ncbi:MULTISPECIES: hypothetical protein [Streptomyces violaceoruber group]|uniref:hypothetical protein n=1 Tax=Streptomyces violaceoruber group TaxID=2867121 RepID=UPI00068FCF12|nr:hypothetical protein [Streptomyces violaceoruber]
MFHSTSRYAGAGTYEVTRPDGTVVLATRLPLPTAVPVAGWHRRSEGERLDLLAGHYLEDPTASWMLGLANGAMVLDALAVRDLVAVPRRA